MERFIPKRAFFEPNSLKYPLGHKLYKTLQSMGVEIAMTSSHNRVIGIPGANSQEAYREAKKTLVVGVRKSKDFANCKPSAHYQLPLNTSCPGMCEYCYLATTLGKKPYLRIYVNIDEVLAKAKEYINKKALDITIFEGAATSDPIPTEYLTGTLKKTIEFFANEPLAKFRFVTKFTDIDSLINAKHNGHTTFRFSLNADWAIKRYEHLVPTMNERINAANKIAQAGYPLGFIIAPIFIFENYQLEYEKLFKALKVNLPQSVHNNVSFEFITHRFTTRAKDNILTIFPNTALPLNEDERKYKFGQFGYGKYIYEKEPMSDIKNFMQNMLIKYFPNAKSEYFV